VWPFGIAPHIRFKGQVGEQATMFFRDPSGNALEFKAFADDDMLFAS
jgi:extradiol dioxygenase family protein